MLSVFACGGPTGNDASRPQTSRPLLDAGANAQPTAAPPPDAATLRHGDGGSANGGSPAADGGADDGGSARQDAAPADVDGGLSPLDGATAGDPNAACADGSDSSSPHAASCTPWSDCVEGSPPTGTSTRDTACLSDPIALTTGSNHTCVVHDNGAVTCWGDNEYGQLGDGTTVARTAPTPVSGLGTAVAVSSKAEHTCALLGDGTIQCWGRNTYGALGDGTTTDRNAPVAVSGITRAVAVATGWDHSCALLDDGTVECWGRNNGGPLGTGDTTDSTIPVQVVGISGAVAMALGRKHTCALLADGSVNCWGQNSKGTLGDGSFGNGESGSLTPVVAKGITSAVSISAGEYYTCAVLGDGGTYCWGDGEYGQIGAPGAGYVDEPTPVNRTNPNDTDNAVSVAGNFHHTCALLRDATLRCWGQGGDGQLGDGYYSPDTVPKTVRGIASAVAVSVGEKHSCALLADHTVQCWGANEHGQLGNPRLPELDSPLEVPVAGSIAQVSAGANHTCLLLDDGTVQCWGRDMPGSSLSPTQVEGIAHARRIASGDDHACAVLDDGAVWCWGDNLAGQLGNAMSGGSSEPPVRVSGITSAVALAPGGSHTCALLSDGDVYCWGSNDFGKLGDGTTTDRFAAVRVDLANLTALDAGASCTCALNQDTTVACWGYNGLGQLGDGSATDSSSPVSVAELQGVRSLELGSRHACAVLDDDDTVRCWGAGAYGQLGDGNATVSLTPVEVPGLGSVASLSAGDLHTCARLNTGQVACWGVHTYSLYASGEEDLQHVSHLTPVVIPGVNNVMQLAAGGGHTMALTTDGKLLGWGRNSYGEAAGGAPKSSVPIDVEWNQVDSN